MAVDVRTTIDIDRPRDEVAAFAAEPDNAPSWYTNIKRVEWKSAKPLTVGSRIEFGAEFLGRKLDYTYEVKEHVPGERFVMTTAEGPFPMQTTAAGVTRRTAAPRWSCATRVSRPASSRSRPRS